MIRSRWNGLRKLKEIIKETTMNGSDGILAVSRSASFTISPSSLQTNTRINLHDSTYQLYSICDISICEDDSVASG